MTIISIFLVINSNIILFCVLSDVFFFYFTVVELSSHFFSIAMYFKSIFIFYMLSAEKNQNIIGQLYHRGTLSHHYAFLSV